MDDKKRKEMMEFCFPAVIKLAANYHVSLDFSDESVQGVSELLNIFHESYLEPEIDGGQVKQKEYTLAYIFGVYVGEVLIRNYGGGYDWEETSFGIALVKDEKNIINPIGKAEKQIIYGIEAGDDIKGFFDVAISIIQGKFQR